MNTNNIVILAQEAPAAPAAPVEIVPAEIAPGAPSDVPVNTVAAPNGGWSSILVWVLLFAGLWFLMFMPQRKKAKEQQKMQASLAVGDKVVTAGGIYGKIVSIDDNTATLEVDQGRITFVRQQIVHKL